MDIAYVAGFIDGEGFIGIQRNNLVLKIAQCRDGVLHKLKQTFGGNVHSKGLDYEKHPQWSKASEWALYNQKTCDLLKECLPYLVVKREEAEYAIQFWEADDRIENQKQYYDGLRELRQSFKER
jgi:hypothetical protein